MFKSYFRLSFTVSSLENIFKGSFSYTELFDLGPVQCKDNARLRSAAHILQWKSFLGLKRSIKKLGIGQITDIILKKKNVCTMM